MYGYSGLNIMTTTTTTLFTHNFGKNSQVSLTEYQVQRRLNLRVLDGTFPAQNYVGLTVRDVRKLLQLIPQVSQILASEEETFFDLSEDIRLSVTRGCIDIRLRWTPPHQEEKVFTKRGLYMKQYEFTQLTEMLNDYKKFFN